MPTLLFALAFLAVCARSSVCSLHHARMYAIIVAIAVEVQAPPHVPFLIISCPFLVVLRDVTTLLLTSVSL